MPHQSDSPAKRRPNFFWWTLINLLALAFAVLSWTGCYFLFNFPERPWNYSVLERLGRLPEITFFKGEELPKATTLPPQQLYGLIYQRNSEVPPGQHPKLLDPTTLQTLNVQLKRNYLTNFKKPMNLNYVRGTWRILSLRQLTKDDFVQHGFAVLAQALAVPAEQENSTNPELLPFPVELEIILPTAPGVEIPPDTEITTDNLFELDRVRHGLIIIHIARSGTADEPVSRITTIPLLDKPFPLSKEANIQLTVPDKVNPKGTFPLMNLEE
ncbi:hypothetical protein [Roseibacillus persicicus]|uniref:hypothetical protein n=1 Tax=Roseibacillus persicicus TaxID=454148 RepID=UPI00280F2D15|nr:hypothetical protein [Roseibacillus persicicus]MDQ8190017.1 hypothetical protein [Roseibacillus persicicus]